MSSAEEEVHHDLEIQEVDAGSQEKATIPVNKLKKGGYVLIEGRPCRVVDITKSKTGKHGHAKAGIAGTDLFTGRRYETHLPTSHEIEVPFVDRSDYGLINIDDNHTQLLTLDGTLREDVDLPPEGNEMRQRVIDLFNQCVNTNDQVVVTVLSSNGENLIVDCKKSTN
uniref:Eukaryotic translation initiation factor 5A n=1 Tax=Trichomonas vaginalis TaxID=5722 RepID=D5I1Q2_TRIVA|nr:translation initiation factor 5A 2 [Trichomonas vaginalis]